MQQQQLDLAQVSRAFRELAERKGWQAYHTPKNLAAAVSVEAAELLENFQWLTDAEAAACKDDIAAKTRVADEISDVLMYLVELCEQMEIDLATAVAEKIRKNREK